MPVELCRTLRFCLNDPEPGAEGHRAEPPAKRNTFSAFPPMRGLGRYYELDLCCVGEPDPVTGYFINIREIDDAARRHCLPRLQQAVHAGASGGSGASGGAGGSGGASAPLGELLRGMFQAVDPALDHTVFSLSLRLTPWYRLEIRRPAMDRVILRQQYEFAAAHRLHVDELSDEENRAVFGKCNNPSGHGHNYRLEVAVAAPIDAEGRILDVELLDAVVDQTVIERYDHKHLSVDVPEFAGRNSSVEHIAQSIYRLLLDPIAGLGAALEEVRVWETSKTVCVYRGDAEPAPRVPATAEEAAEGWRG